MRLIAFVIFVLCCVNLLIGAYLGTDAFFAWVTAATGWALVAFRED